MVYAIFEIALGCVAIMAGCMYYSFGGTLWHVMGISMALLSVPAFGVGALMMLNKI